MTRALATILAVLLLMGLPARADYRAARGSFDGLAPEHQATVVLALIASGDFEGIARHDFTMGVYGALREFELREGYPDDGVLDGDQLQHLGEIAARFRQQIGARHYAHPVSGLSLLVPRGLFDAEKRTPEGLLFTRDDGVLSLLFIAVPEPEKSFEQLWRRLSQDGPDKRIIYERRFASRFVVTGTFHQAKFYTMMVRRGGYTTGFTFSWGAPMDEMGRKVSTFLANAFAAEQR